MAAAAIAPGVGVTMQPPAALGAVLWVPGARWHDPVAVTGAASCFAAVFSHAVHDRLCHDFPSEWQCD
jgi:hypothetical protein